MQYKKKESKATTCNSGIPDGHWFKSYLLHFWSRFLLMSLCKAAENVPTAGSSPTHVRDEDDAPGSLIPLGRPLAIAIIWGVKQQM